MVKRYCECIAYDKAGGLQEETVYNLMNSDAKNWSYKTQWTFNDNSQLIKLLHINSENKVYSAETYKYNGDGLLVKKTSKMEDEPLKTLYMNTAPPANKAG